MPEIEITHLSPGARSSPTLRCLSGNRKAFLRNVRTHQNLPVRARVPCSFRCPSGNCQGSPKDFPLLELPAPPRATRRNPPPHQRHPTLPHPHPAPPKQKNGPLGPPSSTLAQQFPAPFWKLPRLCSAKPASAPSTAKANKRPARTAHSWLWRSDRDQTIIVYGHRPAFGGAAGSPFHVCPFTGVEIVQVERSEGCGLVRNNSDLRRIIDRRLIRVHGLGRDPATGHIRCGFPGVRPRSFRGDTR
jgi:hypothetical protein